MHTAQARQRQQRTRMRRDQITAGVIRTGGIAVMALVCAIFVYLLAVTLPLLMPAGPERYPEPEFNFVLLAAGTLKVALYSMAFAAPLALFSAVYTACFTTQRLRAWIKPGIELMAALPTVVLGFLAGFWLAPIIERTGAALITFLLLIPCACFAISTALRWLPHHWRSALPDGWQAVLLCPVMVACALLAAHLALLPVNDGWLGATQNFDQARRYAIVIGIAMGIAVIPVIFTLTEEAVHSVPQHMVQSALALGASRWQTLTRVVLPVAFPGILAALMLGLGRAVGETMILLMISNSPLLLPSEPGAGLRTLATNLAVALPTAEVASPHYRLLFLSALILFVFTFLVNTIGEVIRQHLRNRYARL